MARKKKMDLRPEDAKLNLTPMIDMTFLLVVFFMVTIDLQQKEFRPVELPYATQGVEDKEDTGEIKRLIINLTSEGLVAFKKYEFSLQSEDPAVQATALVQLKRELKALIQMQGQKALEPDGSSKVPVLVHADWGTQWKYVQWVMQACADENIQIYKIHFAVRKPLSDEELAATRSP